MQTKFFILVGNQGNCDKHVGKPEIWWQVYFLKTNCDQESFFFFSNLERVCFLFVFCFVLLHLMACRILVPGHGTKAMPLGVEAWSPDHWTAREFPMIKSLKKEINI